MESKFWKNTKNKTPQQNLRPYDIKKTFTLKLWIFGKDNSNKWNPPTLFQITINRGIIPDIFSILRNSPPNIQWKFKSMAHKTYFSLLFLLWFGQFLIYDISQIGRKVVPYIQRVKQHINKNEVDNKTITKVQNQVRRKVFPYIQRVEQHINKNEVDNKTDTQVQNKVRRKVVPYIQREVQKLNKTQVENKSETEVKNEVQKQVVAYIQREVVNKTEVVLNLLK